MGWESLTTLHKIRHTCWSIWQFGSLCVWEVLKYLSLIIHKFDWFRLIEIRNVSKQNYESFRKHVSEAINMLLESGGGSSDNSVACTIKEWQRVAYQGDKKRIFTYFCCSCTRFFDIHSRLLLIRIRSTTSEPSAFKIQRVETKNYCITIIIQKISSSYKFILKQILGSHEL